MNNSVCEGRLSDIAKTVPNYLLPRIAVARLGTEVASRTAGRWVLSNLPKDILSKTLGTYVVEPNLERSEKLLDTFLPAVETEEDKKARALLSRADRVKRISDELSNQSIDAVSNFLFQMFGQQAFDWMVHVPALHTFDQSKVVLADRTMQLGSIFLLNTILLKPNLKLQEYVSGVLQKQWGMSKEDAADRATRLINETTPNAMGMLGSILMHHKLSKG